jgi:16S rRNA (cytosine1402-N4)-methyltransferase
VSHIPVLLNEVISYLPELREGCFLDVTAGGGGHFFEILKIKKNWHGECWDTDPLAESRILNRAKTENVLERTKFISKNFLEPPDAKFLKSGGYNFILGDLGVSSFQLDDPTRGFSIKSTGPVDFRLNPSTGQSFLDWLKGQSPATIQDLLEKYGDEPRAKKLSVEIFNFDLSVFESAQKFAEKIAGVLNYKSPSQIHPATRTFQALRIAVNGEFEALDSLLSWGPEHLFSGGSMAIISFHSLEDRLVKNTFRSLAADKDFDILTLKPVVSGASELLVNPRARSAKLRVLRRR